MDFWETFFSNFQITPLFLKNRYSNIAQLFQLEEARQLDQRQKEVLSIGVEYAKSAVTFNKSRISPNLTSPNQQQSTSANSYLQSQYTNFTPTRPSPPLIIVHGGAGTGKSRVINSLYTMMSSIFKQPGDDPCCPYVVLSSFTGAASANIGGQTLHSLFGFKFGNSFLSMTEKQRAEKRNLFRNLRCIIVDEISMVSADLFYNLDLRLREITMVDEIMGGLSVFVFGDLFQLQPPKARYVFEEPKNREHALVYRLRNLWKQFTIIHLEENHRQGEDKQYGDLLNRVRVGLHTEEDIELLRTRVVAQDDPALNNAVHIYGTNAKVNSRNDAKLKEIPGELIRVRAQNHSRTVKKFSRNNAGCIMNTPFQAVLNLKINAEVVLVHNICTLDGLTNGARGVLVAVEKDGDTV